MSVAPNLTTSTRATGNVTNTILQDKTSCSETKITNWNSKTKIPVEPLPSINVNWQQTEGILTATT